MEKERSGSRANREGAEHAGSRGSRHRLPSAVKGSHPTFLENPMLKSRDGKRRYWPWLLLLIGLLAIIGVFSTDLIPSESMLPTLRPGDQILTMRSWLAYPAGRIPARRDVVIFHTPG